MRRWQWLCGVAVLAGGVAWGAPVDLYVAPTGDDARDGRTVATAVATPARALKIAGELRAAGWPADGVVVHVASGTYRLREALALGPGESGRSGGPLVVRGEGAVAPTFSGGTALRGFRPYRGPVRQLDLKAAGWSGPRFEQLFCGGQRMVLARVPNLDPADIHGGQWAHVAETVPDDLRASFRCAPKEVDPRRWARPGDGRVNIFPYFDWAFNRLPIRSVEPDGRLALKGKVSYDLHVGDRYFVEGLLEELDRHGEWYLDAAAAVLYFAPPEGVTDPEVVLPQAKQILSCRGASHVRFERLTLQECESEALLCQDSESVMLVGCTVRNTGGWGVRLTGGRACRVESCELTATGAGGIEVNGGDRRTLTPAGHEVVNCTIHHIAAFARTYNCAVNLQGVGNRVANCLLHDTPHAGVALAGNDNLFEYNVVHHTNLQSTDTGGLYSCPRDWTQRGNVLRYNVWHHIGGFGKASSWQPVSDGRVKFEYPHFTWGIYMDDPTSGNLIYGNVLYEVPVCGLHNHGGRDNVWENNIVVDCPAFQAGMLTPDWEEWPSIIRKLREVTTPGSAFLTRYPVLGTYTDQHPEEMSGLKVVRNIFYYTAAGTTWNREHRVWGCEGDTMRLYTMHVRGADFAKNEFSRNLVYAEPSLKLSIELGRSPEPTRKLTWQQWQELGQDRDSQLADPLFEDPARHDYRLRPDSPALKLGFKPIPLDRIGPYQDRWRATWPLVEAPGATGRAKPTARYFAVPGFEPLPARLVVPRGGLGNTIAKLQAGRTVRIAYYGGGIHAADGWRQAMLRWFQQTWPQARIEAIDGSITDAVRGSGFSVYRFAHDVLAQRPDLVVVDYASDDHQTPAYDIQRAVEGVVRQAIRRDPSLDLVFLYAFRAGFEAAYADGVTPPTVTAYERLAEHYSLPSINLGPAAAKVWTAKAWPGGVVPNQAANEAYATALLEGLRALAAGPAPALHTLPRPLRPDHLEAAAQVPITASMLTGSWRELPADDANRRAQARHFDTIWYTNTPGAKLTFSFTGTEASLFDLMGPDTGRVLVTVDGQPAGIRQQVDPWSYFQRLAAVPLAAGLKPGAHTITIELLPEPPDRSVPIAEARKRPGFDAKAFEGVALRIGWLRIVGAMP